MLSDAKGTIRAVEFAPHHFGLKLVRLFILFIYVTFAELCATGHPLYRQRPPNLRAIGATLARNLDAER